MGNAARSRIVVGLLAAVMLVLGGGWAAASETVSRRGSGDQSSGDQSGDALYGCDRTMGRQPEGNLHKRTAPAEDSPVHPGETIRVTLTWDTADWSASQLHKVLDCVAVDGQLVRSLQDGESPTDNDGRFTREFSVPDDVRPGTRVCDQAMLSGPSPRADYDRQISNEVCHTVERSTARRGGGCGKCGSPCGKKDEGAGCGPKKEGGGCRQNDGCAKPGDCNEYGGCKKGGGEKTCGDKKENENGDAGGCATGGGTCDKEDGSGCTKSECGKQKEGGDCGKGDCAGKSSDCAQKGRDGDCGCPGHGHRRGRVSKLLDPLIPGAPPKSAESPLIAVAGSLLLVH